MEALIEVLLEAMGCDEPAAVAIEDDLDELLAARCSSL
jgi:hypothetical protein